MSKLLSALLLCTGLVPVANAQTLNSNSSSDTTSISTITVKGYLSNKPMLSIPASVSVITPDQLKMQQGNSLVSGMNTVPGVRMEERSPGSYRLSVRGSLLRSPFGIRDVKIYFDELPLTDAGGNTYLNALDFNSVKNVEVLKGPDGSLFGANSGGVVLLSPVNRLDKSNYVTAGFSAGSYGLVQQNAGLQNISKNNQLNINQAYQTFHGYRDHSDMRRNYIQLVDKITYGEVNSLKILGFYADLKYQTPGGLTLAQAAANPRAARPSTATIPGAIAQQAGISNKMTYGGAVNEWFITPKIRNVFGVYGAYVNFTNPFITNYEQRYERTLGMRTYFEFTGNDKPNVRWKANVGMEMARTNTDANNYGNRGGVRDTIQSLDRVNAKQSFIFARWEEVLYNKLHIEAAASLNYYGYNFKNIHPRQQSDFSTRSFTPQVMPRLAMSYEVTNNFVWRVSASKGYSTPTSAEVRPSNNIINTDLNAQHGWNFETGFRLRNADETMLLDVSAFYYRLNNAIVRRLTNGNTEYYTNLGQIKQPGLELYFMNWLIKPRNEGFIRGLQISESLTISKFSFGTYSVASAGYAGNELTGVPRHVSVTSLQVKFPQSVYLYSQFNSTARIPLNEANTFYSPRYQLLQAKVGWQSTIGKSRLELFAGADNILNQYYNLGADLDAVGNRFYNPSPLRNYYAGFNVRF